MFGISEIAIIAIVLILFLGAKKLPELARSMGTSARILKSEARAMKNMPATPGAAGPASGAGHVIEPDAVIIPHPAHQADNDTPRR
ncbi:twin-arginine translocase TatA/TatE family subunit [Streptomyces globosus]|uniref:Twin-arginine translocase TatA/TatE family subunit n=1 Tax=Streptomyces globosus TaxID=68209 RepID=A0A344U3G2_9ACTN|nr:twin-arginine translocase TatA/TatE family subunit [Streptomyces globosus]AXE25433.1 twin-arginine translocase TatA/TatE family subunit [Streptomyces globosus]